MNKETLKTVRVAHHPPFGEGDVLGGRLGGTCRGDSRIAPTVPLAGKRPPNAPRGPPTAAGGQAPALRIWLPSTRVCTMQRGGVAQPVAAIHESPAGPFDGGAFPERRRGPAAPAGDKPPHYEGGVEKVRRIALTGDELPHSYWAGPRQADGHRAFPLGS